MLRFKALSRCSLLNSRANGISDYARFRCDYGDFGDYFSAFAINPLTSFFSSLRDLSWMYIMCPAG